MKRGDDSNWTDREQIDFQRCYNECEAMYLAGSELPEIATQQGVTLKRLQGWHKKYVWDAKRQAMLESPKGIGAMLRENLRKQVQKLAGGDQLKVDQVEEITKITKCIKEIEGCGGDFFSATVEVLRGFSAFIRKQISDRETYHLVSSWVQEYLRSLTDV
jgi:hypothetical protein